MSRILEISNKPPAHHQKTIISKNTRTNAFRVLAAQRENKDLELSCEKGEKTHASVSFEGKAGIQIVLRWVARNN